MLRCAPLDRKRSGRKIFAVCDDHVVFTLARPGLLSAMVRQRRDDAVARLAAWLAQRGRAVDA